MSVTFLHRATTGRSQGAPHRIHSTPALTMTTIGMGEIRSLLGRGWGWDGMGPLRAPLFKAHVQKPAVYPREELMR